MNFLEFTLGALAGIVVTKIMSKKYTIKGNVSPLLPLNMRHSVPGTDPLSIANHAMFIVQKSKETDNPMKFTLHMGLTSATDGVARAALLVAVTNWLRCDMYYKHTRQALQDAIAYAETRNSEVTSYMTSKLMETESPLEDIVKTECATFMQDGLCGFLALEERAIKDQKVK